MAVGFPEPSQNDLLMHNQEVKELWEAYRRGEPWRVPVIFNYGIRCCLLDPSLNTEGYTFQQYFEDPDVMLDAQLKHLHFKAFNLWRDEPMGYPEEGWQIFIDFQNTFEAPWFGCPVRYYEDQVPDSVEILRERKSLLYEMEIPDPLSVPIMQRAIEFYEYFREKCPKMEFMGRPVLPPQSLPGAGTDGPFTVAFKLRGATELCLDIYEDPQYVHDLLSFITEATIQRIKAVRQYLIDRKDADPHQFEAPGWGFADDAVEMLSPEVYREFVLPYHKRLVDTFANNGPVSVHLCGNASHIYPVLVEELGVASIDTGFPVDHGRLREQLGPDVEILGGPSIMLLKAGPVEAVVEEVKRILQSGVMTGRRFILREGNNVAPGTPLSHLRAMYEAAKVYGRY